MRDAVAETPRQRDALKKYEHGTKKIWRRLEETIQRSQGSSLASIENLTATIPFSSYAINDNTAIKIVDGSVQAISGRNWKLFNVGKTTTGKA